MARQLSLTFANLYAESYDGDLGGVVYVPSMTQECKDELGSFQHGERLALLAVTDLVETRLERQQVAPLGVALGVLQGVGFRQGRVTIHDVLDAN